MKLDTSTFIQIRINTEKKRVKDVNLNTFSIVQMPEIKNREKLREEGKEDV